MRIAYIAPYQGADLIKRRRILRNLALAGNVKIELISELLRTRDHDVEVISQGEVVDTRLEYFRAFAEPRPFHHDIPVMYASSLPVRFMNGFWSSQRTLSLFKQRHRVSPFDAVIIYNLKSPQVTCAAYAMKRLDLPVIFEYEDDAFVSLQGDDAATGFRARLHLESARQVMDGVSACIGVSPHLLSKVSDAVPKMLLRGVVDGAILEAGKEPTSIRKNWVVYSGTHYRGKGLEQLIAAWNSMSVPNWELHVAGRGELTAQLEDAARHNPTVVFHGLLDRAANARLLAAARIGINPHDVSATPGNVFAFKIIEYLAAGAHCITTPMGFLEPELEAGITYMPDNTPQTIAATLQRVIRDHRYERLATEAAHCTYGPDAVARELDRLVTQVSKARTQ
jgi:hypothetical protein